MFSIFKPIYLKKKIQFEKKLLVDHKGRIGFFEIFSL